MFEAGLKNFLFTDPSDSNYHDNLIGYENNKVKWYRMIMLSSEGKAGDDYDTLQPIYERWESKIKEINDGSPTGVNKAF